MKRVLLILVLVGLFASCSRDDGNITDPISTESVLITSLEYISETIHDSFYGEVGDRYINSVSFTIGLNEPQLYDQIDRIIIYNDEVALGWEFSKEMLSNAFIDTLGGFLFKHVVYPIRYGAYYDRIFKATLYNEQNEIISEYDFLLKENFPSFVRLDCDWYDKTSLLVKTNNLNKYPEVVNVTFLNGLEIIDIVKYQIVGNEYILDNVPNNSDSFFIEYLIYPNNQEQISISEREYLDARIPSDALVLPENMSIDNSIYMENTNRLAFMNKNDSKIYFWDISLSSITNEINLPAKPSSMSLGQSSMYVGLDNGGLYEILESGELSFLYNFAGNINSLTKAGNYIIVNISQYYSEFWVYGINEKLAIKFERYSYDKWTHMLFNDSNNTLYCSNNQGNDGIISINFNPVTGQLSDLWGYDNYNYRILAPFKIFPDSSKVISASGHIFSCGSSNVDDLGLLGIIQDGFTDMVFSDENKFIFIYSYTSPYYNDEDVAGTIKIINPTTYELEKSLSLFGTPLAIYSLTDDYLVLSKINTSNRYFIQNINKRSLESDLLGKHSEKYMLPSF